MFVFHTLVNCSALAFFIFSRLKLVPPTAERSVHDTLPQEKMKAQQTQSDYSGKQ